MRIHELRDLAHEEQRAIESIMAAFEETHRTFNHLIGELEALETLTRELEAIPDGTRRMRLIKERGGRQLVRNLQATLQRLLHDEQALLRESKHIRHRVAADILKALESFSNAA